MRILWINGLQTCAPSDTHSDPRHGHRELYTFHMYSCEWGIGGGEQEAQYFMSVRTRVGTPVATPSRHHTRESSDAPSSGDALQHLHQDQRPFFETVRDR
jgi:hypothetical protein